MAANPKSYPATLDIDYPEKLNRLTTFFRALWAIPIGIILTLLTTGGSTEYVNQAGQHMASHGGGIAEALFTVTALMIIFRQRYPRWWYDFVLELERFSWRVGAYLFLLTDKYPSTEDRQSIHLNLTYPDVKRDLNRWLPIVKWFLAIPHYIVLTFLIIAAFFVTIIAWFAILFTGRYPKGMFDFVVGVGRWSLRVAAYAFFLVTDKYPPFSLD